MPLYESAFHAAIAVTFWRLPEVEALRWQRLKLYLLLYCAFRFGMEFIRTEPRAAWGLTAYQLGSVAFAVILAGLWAIDERAKRRPSASTA